MNQTTNQGYNLVENTDEIQTSLSAWNANFNKIDADVTKLQTNIKVLEDNFDIDTTPNSNNFVLEDSASGYNQGNIKIGDGPELAQATKSYKGMFRVPDTLSQTINELTFTVNNDGSVIVKGTATENTTVDIPLTNQLVLNGTYTFSIKTVGTCPSNTQQWILKGTDLKPTATGGQTKSSTVENMDNTVTELRVYTKANEAIDCTIYPILEEGDTATDWDSAETKLFSPTPDHPQDITVVEGECGVDASNKNLWGGFSTYNNSSAGINYTYNHDGTIKANGTATANSNSASVSTALQQGLYVTLPAGNYFVSGGKSNSMYLQAYDENSNSLGTDKGNGVLIELSKVTKIIVRVYITNGTAVNNETFYIQLEKGSTATSYTSHKGKSFPITLPTEMFLGSIGTASNYIYGTKDNWKLHSGLGKQVIDGDNADFSIINAKANSTYFEQSTRYWKPNTATKVPNMKSNLFKSYKPNDLYSSDVEGITCSNPQSGNGRTRINILNTTASTPEQLTTYVSTHNIIVYGELGESTETDITDSTLVTQLNNIADNLQTYKGQTVVFTTSDNLEPNIQFDYLVNPLASIEARLALLEE